MYFNCCLGQMFVSDVFDFQFVGKVEPYFLSAGEEVVYLVIQHFLRKKLLSLTT